MGPWEALDILQKRGIITLHPKEAGTCCGIERDEDGFCQHRPRHPIYMDLRDPDKLDTMMDRVREKKRESPVYDD
jgi:hypothetical protein